jgi:hypothetical protein
MGVWFEEADARAKFEAASQKTTAVVLAERYALDSYLEAVRADYPAVVVRERLTRLMARQRDRVAVMVEYTSEMMAYETARKGCQKALFLN